MTTTVAFPATSRPISEVCTHMPDSRDPAPFDIDHTGQTAIIRVSGDLELRNAEALQLLALRLLATQDVRIDLGSTTFMDSSGVRALVMVYRQSQATGRRFQLIAPSRAVLRTLEIVKLADVFDIVGRD